MIPASFEYFSPKEKEAALREFPELYRADRPTVQLFSGMIDLSGINESAFGVCSEPDWDFLEKVTR